MAPYPTSDVKVVLDFFWDSFLAICNRLKNSPYTCVCSGNSSKTEPIEYEGYVHQIEDSAIIVGFSKRLRDKFVANMQFNIRFTFNRFPNRNMHRQSDPKLIIPSGKSVISGQQSFCDFSQ